MIFRQIDEILNGTKTQTRRVVKPSQFYLYPDDWPGGVYSASDYDADDGSWSGNARFVYIVGRTYAVVPKRGMPAVWWCNYNDYGRKVPVYRADVKIADRDSYKTLGGWKPLRIRITAIRREPLQSITEADALAEGVESVEAYRALWESINGKTKGARWADNPDVWVLTFEVVR